MKNDGFTFRKRARSFKFAFNGIKLLITKEHNAWIHCFCGSLRTYRRNGIWTFPHGMDRSNDRDRSGISCRGGQFIHRGPSRFVSPEYNDAISERKTWRRELYY